MTGEFVGRLSIIAACLPVYPSKHILKKLHPRNLNALEPVELNSNSVFVENCCGDDSWPVTKPLAVEDNRVHGFKMSRNFDQHATTL